MAERNILAYFHSPEQAEGAKRKLQALRVIEARVDRFDAYPGAGSEGIMNPLTSDFSGLGELTLDGEFSNKSAAIMAAASPDASGLSDKGDENIAGKDILLTVIVSEEEAQKAEAIIRECGGMI